MIILLLQKRRAAAPLPLPREPATPDVMAAMAEESGMPAVSPSQLRDQLRHQDLDARRNAYVDQWEKLQDELHNATRREAEAKAAIALGPPLHTARVASIRQAKLQQERRMERLQGAIQAGRDMGVAEELEAAAPLDVARARVAMVQGKIPLLKGELAKKKGKVISSVLHKVWKRCMLDLPARRPRVRWIEFERAVVWCLFFVLVSRARIRDAHIGLVQCPSRGGLVMTQYYGSFH